MFEEWNEHPHVPPVMGTGDAVGIPDEQRMFPSESTRYWFVARVSPNTEKSTRTKLQSLGYEVFIASQPELRFWKNGMRRKKKMVEKVVITQYLFLHLSRRERETVIRYSFIREFMRNRASQERANFAVVPDRDMQTLIAMFGQSDHAVQFDTSDYSIGDEVLLHLGSCDYHACIVRRHGDKTAYYGIRVGELGCAYMEVPPSALSKQ